MVIEGVGFLDALYMTVITVSTVGYRETFPLSVEGRAFTILLIVSGVGSALYFLSLIGESLLEGRLRDIYRRSAMLREIARRSGHVIVCGYGRFGQIVVEDLRSAGSEVVVVEMDSSLETQLESAGLAYVLGAATDDEVLEQAGIRRARAIVIGLPSESDCVFATLAARELSPEILISARGESDAGVRRIQQAGAHHVISPLKIGGSRATMSILRPTVVDFLELSSAGVREEVDLEEIRVEPGAPLDGARVGELEAASTRVRIVAIKHHDQPIEIIPDRDVEVSAGDHLVVIGARSALSEMALRAQEKPTSGT